MRRVVAAAFLAVAACTAWSAPTAELWERWTAHDPASTIVVGHERLQRFLDRYLVSGAAGGPSAVRYGAVTRDDRAALVSYLDDLQRVSPSGLSRDEQMAYWINLYNGRTVLLILEHYPVKSIRDIRFGTSGAGPWDERLLTVEGERLSLNNIEHNILRPIWKDPRIHYAVNCASISCPELRSTVYTGAGIDRQLDAAARGYIASEQGVFASGGRLRLSSIYDWYRTDFGRNERAVLAHIARYAQEPMKSLLETFRDRIQYGYDWALNDRP